MRVDALVFGAVHGLHRTPFKTDPAAKQQQKTVEPRTVPAAVILATQGTSCTSERARALLLHRRAGQQGG